MKYFSRIWKIITELSESLLLGILFFMILNISLQNYQVVGDSMVPTYTQDDRMVLMKFSYIRKFNSDEFIKPFNPKRGDIIVFKYPLNPERRFIKRIIAVAGDEIAINEGKVFLNGKKVKELYLERDKYKDLSDFEPITIKYGHVFVLGDNRWVSNDSRNWGELSNEFIIGEPWFKYWPLK